MNIDAIVSADISTRIQEVANQSPAAKKLFIYLGEYEKNMSKTYVDNVARDTGLLQFEVRAIFRELGKLKLGELYIGRRGHRTRFEWEAPLTTVAAVALGEKAEADDEILRADWREDADDGDEDEDIDAELPTKKTYRFPLRKGFEALLVLPEDLTAREVERLSAFLKPLAMD